MRSLKLQIGLLFLFSVYHTCTFAQNTGISDVNRTPDASAVLDVYSTSKGVLVPRLNEAQRTAIASPAIGLLVYQTDGATPGFYYYTGTTWTPIASGSGSRWTLEPSTSNIYYNSGFVGVGVTNPRNQLVVNNNLEIRRTGTATDISQLIFSNTANQGNFRIGGDGGDIFWQGGGGQSLQMGSFWTTILTGDRQSAAFPAFITGSTIPNRSVLVRSSRNASIPLSIQGNSSSQTANLTEWLNATGTAINVVSSAGNLGLGVTTPTQKLDVAGNINLSGAFMPNNAPGTAGQILQSAGANAYPTWVDLSTATNNLNWALGGNNLAGIKTLGTTTNFDLPFITNNTEKMRISATGNVGIGSTTFDATNPEKLLVNTGTTTSVNAIVARGNINKYFQTNIQNLSTGNQASSDIVATANNGTETSFFVNLGINGSGFVYSQANNLIAAGAANDGYLLSAGNNFHIVNSNATKDIVFTTGGTATTNEAMRLTAARNLGIGLTPTQKLDVLGNFKLNGAFMPNGNAGTAGQVLQSAGANASPVWVTAGASSSWALGGNSVAALNSLGTTSNFDLPIITNNAEKMRVLANGNIGIGLTAPAEKLDVNGNIRLSATSNTTPRRIMFANTGSDPDAAIEVRPGGSPEQQEMLFYVGNDPANAFGPDRIRMVAEEIRFQNFNADGTSSLANAEAQPASLNTRMIISPAGNVGIGATTFDQDSPEQLLVEANTNTYNAIVARGNINSYFQTNIQNLSTGSQASSDVVATADNGTETTNFINMGINNSGYLYQNGNVIETGKKNDGYILSAGQDFYIVNNNPTKDMIFTVGGTATTNEAMRITGAGERVGIANNAPNSTLSVNGTLSMAVRNVSGGTTLSATDHVIINTTNGTATWALPAANSCKGRIYRVINHGSGTLTFSTSIIVGYNTTATSLNAGAAVELISDGTNWRRMDD
ncbi:beta strand repeat-containing protein [Adhaeribacter radiodurans]|uniref:Uncharacterized protein n=1 Tax=Adhaeribacter radiodurans TaxID=2745197 RepID=A0A7L7LCP6_9BACT|nr:hypothetical protein [Adhaeribacter radiodurans]QMU30464.1 hypothetical protein HUW48_21645 [Adhaeribacter radiodurans]